MVARALKNLLRERQRELMRASMRSAGRANDHAVHVLHADFLNLVTGAHPQVPCGVVW
jgi:hypothetical protein